MYYTINDLLKITNGENKAIWIKDINGEYYEIIDISTDIDDDIVLEFKYGDD